MDDGWVVGLTAGAAVVTAVVGDVGEVCCCELLEAAGGTTLHSLVQDDGEVVAGACSFGGDELPSVVGSVIPLGLELQPPLVESVRLSVSLFKSSMLQGLQLLLLERCSV